VPAAMGSKNRIVKRTAIPALRRHGAWVGKRGGVAGRQVAAANYAAPRGGHKIFCGPFELKVARRPASNARRHQAVRLRHRDATSKTAANAGKIQVNTEDSQIIQRPCSTS
jgi:hypothetical protein